MPDTPQVNYTLIRLMLETIPFYEGDKDLLEIFINAADNFYNQYAGISDELRKFAHQALLGKLKGNALLIIGSRAELTSWPLVREELRNVYGEHLSLDNLEQMLMTCSIQKNEHYQNFAKRLQLIRSKLAQKITTTPPNIMDAATKIVHNRQYNALACKIFVRNLDRRLRDKIIVQSPNSLEAAMALVQEDENFELFLNPNPNSFKQLIPRSIKPAQTTQAISQSHLKPQIHTPSQNFQHLQTQNYRQNFPSQPINIQPRQINQNFPTNRQTFGPPQNVWKPQNRPNNNPVPMSGISKIPSNLPHRQTYQPTPMSTNTRLTPRPFHRNTELNTHHELDTCVDNENDYYQDDEHTPVVNNAEECDYSSYDTASYEIAQNDIHQDFLTTSIPNNQT